MNLTVNRERIIALAAAKHPLIAMMEHEGLITFETITAVPAFLQRMAERLAEDKPVEPKIAVASIKAIQVTAFPDDCFQVKLYCSVTFNFNRPDANYNIKTINGKASHDGLEFTYDNGVMTISDGRDEMTLPQFVTTMSNGSPLRPDTYQSRCDLTGIRARWSTGPISVCPIIGGF